jgi:hypothetical protein
VLADPLLAGIHRRSQFGDEPLPVRVRDLWHLHGPGPDWLRNEWADAAADAGVEDAGHVPGTGKTPLLDRRMKDLLGVAAGELGGAQRPPQPLRLMARTVPVLLGERLGEQLLVVLVPRSGGFAGPHGIEDRQVVGVRQGPLLDLGS